MLRNGVIVCALVALSACGDPLRGIDRLSDVDLAEIDPVRQALPSDAEFAREGFFGTAAATTPVASLKTPTAAAPPKKPTGLLARLRSALPVARAGARQRVAEPAAFPQGLAVSVQPDQTETVVPSVSPAPAAPRETGLLSRLVPTFGAAAPQTGPDAIEVPYGTVLPYGEVARVCEARRKSLGRKVESASASGYKLYDSAPGAKGPRTYYITGFDDGCPRQLTAAHVLLGAPSFYELLHYGPTGAHLTTGATDRAYEQVKSRVCGVRKGKPCGSKMRSLERSTFFVNTYERPDDNTRWSELLVHEGQVVASALKTN